MQTLIKTIKEFLIKTAHAQNEGFFEITLPTCYLPAYPPPIQNFLHQVFYILGPLIVIIKSILHARKLLKKESFSVAYESFNVVKTILKISIILLLILYLLSLPLLSFMGYSPKEALTFENGLFGALILFCLNSIAAGIVYLFFSFKGIRFLKLALLLLLVLPAFACFVRILLCKHIKSLNKYLPKESAEKKKADLKEKFVSEGKIKNE